MQKSRGVRSAPTDLFHPISTHATRAPQSEIIPTARPRPPAEGAASISAACSNGCAA
jgi:hypothetical protein